MFSSIVRGPCISQRKALDCGAMVGKGGFAQAHCSGIPMSLDPDGGLEKNGRGLRAPGFEPLKRKLGNESAAKYSMRCV
jgi:hypothetical protein